MTLPTSFSFLKTSKDAQNNLTTMKAVALMVFLLLFLTSVLAHADHLVIQETTVEQQDCHICNQGIDTPPELPPIQALAVSRHTQVISQLTTTKFTLNNFVQPPSRGPPFVQ